VRQQRSLSAETGEHGKNRPRRQHKIPGVLLSSQQKERKRLDRKLKPQDSSFRANARPEEGEEARK
jgi:hypothetical protein